MAPAPLDPHAIDLRAHDAEVHQLEIVSANPRNFHEAINNPTAAPPVTIKALLAVRRDAPTVIVVPGSAGIGPNHLAHARTLLDTGYSVCLVDPFGGRSVVSTVANQAQYSFAASAFDVLAALRTITEVPGVDAARIAAQGHSRGGAAVLMAAARQLADPVVGPELAFAGIYAAYPWCGQQFAHPNVGTTKVRAIIGDRDDWGSVVAAQAQINSLRVSGADATMRVVAGAPHSFDRDEAMQLVAEARVSPNAPIEYLDDDGSMIDPYRGVRDPDRTDLDQFRAAVANGFGQRGAHMGSSDESQPPLFRDDMLAFHASVFGR